MKSVYIHEEYTHNLDSPSQIVPVLIDIFTPASVIDVGCGIGTFLHSFKQQGVKQVVGVDGSWANKDLVYKYLKPEEFIEQDLSENIQTDRQFDLAICLEVAEHLSAEKAESLVKNLTKLSKVIVFSAAIPCQGGQNHINEQWSGYWQNLFRQHKFYFKDVLRPYFWQNDKIHWWYRQNMFVVLHESVKDKFQFPQIDNNAILDFVHPQLLYTKQEEIDKIKAGKLPLKSYVKFLLKKLTFQK
jgi:SAM-dependent methyltransferase